jgi:mycothione reductase
LPELPRRLAVLGGGYVGTELAHVLDAFGSDVTQVETEPRLLADHDVEVGEALTAFARGRWDVRTSTVLRRVSRAASGAVCLHLAPAGEDGGEGTTLEVDTLLVAVGRVPNSDRLDVGAAGIEVDDDGVVLVDEHQRTRADGVWALGDVASRLPFKTTANDDARTVQHNLLHPDDLVTRDRRFVPEAVFTSPQMAKVGRTEQEASDDGVDLAVASVDVADVAYGWAMEDDRRPDRDDGARHLVKLLADRATGLLVGAHVVAPQACVLVQPLVLAMSLGLPVRGLARAQYWIHPGLGEVVESALLALEDELENR